MASSIGGEESLGRAPNSTCGTGGKLGSLTVTPTPVSSAAAVWAAAVMQTIALAAAELTHDGSAVTLLETPAGTTECCRSAANVTAARSPSATVNSKGSNARPRMARATARAVASSMPTEVQGDHGMLLIRNSMHPAAEAACLLTRSVTQAKGRHHSRQGNSSNI